MSDERLRLLAEVRDNATPGIRRLKSELENVKRTPGMEAASKWMEAFSERSREFVRDGGGVSGAMGAIGIGGITAAASLAEMVRQFKELAEHTDNMKEMARQTGLSADQLNQWQYAATKLHVDPEKMTSAIGTWSGKLLDFHNHLGELYGQLNAFDPNFARKLSFEEPEQGLEDMLGYLASIPEAYQKAGHSAADAAQLQKRFFGLAFGDESLSRLGAEGPEGIAKALEEARKNVKPVTREMEEEADKLNESIVQFNESWKSFETGVGTPVFRQLRAATDDFRNVFEEIQAVYSKMKDRPDDVKKDVEGGAEGIWDKFKDHWANVFSGKESLLQPPSFPLPNPFEAGKEATNPLKVPLWNPPAPDAAPPPPNASLEDLKAELVAVRDKLLADRNKPGFAVKDAAEIARLRELNLAIEHFRQPAPAQPEESTEKREAPDDRPAAPEREANPLLHRSSFIEGEDTGVGVPGGTRDFVAAIGAGTKLGFLAAFRELMQDRMDDDGKPKGGGLIKAAYETGGSRGGDGPHNGFGLREPSGAGDPGSGAGGGFDPRSQTKWPDRPEPKDHVALAKESYDFWRSKGLSDLQAAANVAQEEGESSFNIHAVGDHGTAKDAFQWHADRRARILRNTGIDVDTAGHRQQLEAAYWEFQHTHKNAWNALKAANTFHDAVAAGVSKFEVSGDQPGDIAKRTPMAEGWSHRFANLPSGMPEQPVAEQPTGDFRAPQNQDAVNAARAYLKSVAGGGALRPDAISKLNPEFAYRAAEAISDARAHGLPNAGLYSGYRSPGQTGSRYDAMRLSGHSYGIAADFSGIGAPGSPQSRAFDAIARKYGLGGYGPDNPREWNHKELFPFHLEKNTEALSALRHTLGPNGAMANPERTWDATNQFLKDRAVPVQQVARPPLVPEDRQDRARPDLMDEANKAGAAGPLRVHHTGGAELSVRLEDGRIRGVRAKSEGLIKAVHLQRGPTFSSPSEVG